MATNKYGLLTLNNSGKRDLEYVEADGFRIKDDGWIHFYVDGATPDSPKETVLSLAPAYKVVRIGKVTQQ